MSDKVEHIAFNDNAPTDERVDALGAIQKSHIPTASDILYSSDMRELISEMQRGYEEEAFNKAINPNIVPFPSKQSKEKKNGMQSLYLDDYAINLSGDYWERPSSMGFDSLRSMTEQTPILNAVIMTRIRQVQRFARISETDVALPGFEIRHVDRKHSLTKSEQDNINMLNRFVTNGGWEFSARKRKVLRRDSFANFMGKVVRDTLTMDSVAIETEWKKDKSKGLEGFYALDGGSIRLCSEDGYRGDDEIFALQVVGGNIRTAYTFDDLIYEPRNPRSDVRVGGYGLSETELLIKVVTGFLNAMTVNAKGFDSNSIPKGVLHLSGNYSKQDLDAFKRYWNSMVKGVNNAWSVPVLVSQDQESKASFEKFGVEFNEMMFSKWMTFLTSIICAIYGMSPAEINFDSFTAGSTSALAGSDTAEKLSASKDSGLRPLLAYFENLFTDYIISDFNSDYCLRWTGLDVEDADKKHEIRKLVLTVDEMRAEEGYEKHDDPAIGAAPLNPVLMGAYMAGMQPEGGEQEQQQGKGKANDDKEYYANKELDEENAGSNFSQMHKSHIHGYTRKDGVFVEEHDDKRLKKTKSAVDHNSTGKHRAIWVGSRGQYAVQSPDGAHLSYHASNKEANIEAVRLRNESKKLGKEGNKRETVDPGRGDVLQGASSLEWAKSWLWGRKGKDGTVYDVPSDESIIEMSKYIPKEPVKMWRAHPVGKAHGDLESWTTDKSLAQDLVDDSPDTHEDAKKYGIPMRILVERTVDPGDILIDFSMLKKKDREDIENDWHEAVVANGDMVDHIKNLRKQSKKDDEIKKSLTDTGVISVLDWWS